MTGRTITGSISTGVTLTNTADSPLIIEAGASIANASGPALQSALAFYWQIDNSGIIQAPGSSSGVGIALAAGAAVTNEQFGRIAGYSVGVSIAGTGVVVNHGTISSSQTKAPGYYYNTLTGLTPLSGGVIMAGGGVSNAASATIISYFEGVALGGGGGVFNAGSIGATSTASGFGVILPSGGSVSNAATGTITGPFGILSLGTNASTATNQGVIAGKLDTGIDLFSGGYVSNAASGTISGVRNAVVTSGSAVSTVVNLGLVSGGTVTGVYLEHGGTVSNLGTITGVYAVATNGTAASTVANAGTIAGGAQVGVLLYGQGPGYMTNAGTGTITGGYFGVKLANAAGSVVNLGSISSSQTLNNSSGFDAAGVDLSAGGVVTNGVSGQIRATWKGVEIGTTSGTIGGTVFNQGFIYASNSNGSTGAAVWVHGVANISNAASGTIAGGPFGVVLYADALVVNRGTISGTEYAIFEKYTGDSVRLINYPGAVLTGKVEGSNPTGAASGILELASGTSAGTITGFGSKYVGFSNITLDAGAAWSFGGTVAATQQLAFNGANALLTLADPGSMAGTITGFAQSDTIALAGVTDVSGVTLTGTVLTISETAGPGLTLQFDSSVAGATFNHVTSGNATDLTLACFAAGTRILAEQGLVPVQGLRRGMRVQTLLSGNAEILWTGHRRIDCRHHWRPEQVWPVCIRAGAFGPGQPTDEVYLSPDHAVYVNGVLIPIRYLINGTTVNQVEVDEVAYFHIELARHDIVLAQGLPVESYLDIGDRGNFAGDGVTGRLWPDFGVPAPDASAVWDAKGCARLVIAGPDLEAARSLVNDRAAGARRRDQLCDGVGSGLDCGPVGRNSLIAA